MLGDWLYGPRTYNSMFSPIVGGRNRIGAAVTRAVLIRWCRPFTATASLSHVDHLIGASLTTQRPQDPRDTLET